jgi:hypothetical protein
LILNNATKVSVWWDRTIPLFRYFKNQQEKYLKVGTGRTAKKRLAFVTENLKKGI